MAKASQRGGMLQWLGVALIVFIIDQFTKVLILGTYKLGDSTVVTSFFNVVRVHNPGAAFSFLADQGGWQRWLFSGFAVVAAAFILWMLSRHHAQRLFSLALALILGGAVGNLVDRTVHGYVVDFLDFHLGGWHWPAFNVADAAIVCGAALLILDEVLRVRRGR
jgi:signal peptidase II